MARWAIGDVQGCYDELQQLLGTIHFSPDRDRLWFVGDLVNRGPHSLAVLRLARDLTDNAVCVLGNHDLHLLAVALGDARIRARDTLAEILQAPDRTPLLDWLLQRPLAHYEGGDLLVHAGVVPQWSVARTLALAEELQQALRTETVKLLSRMYGDMPDRWRASLSGLPRLRFAINVLTRLRFCTAEGRIDLKHKGKPDSAGKPWMPWFEAPERATAGEARVVFGHWSALGFYRAAGLLGLDSGCVWGGALTAVNLDDPQTEPVSVPSRQPRSNGD
jgi:bis(5'-nucleosyl)-tetraphosphatase (symmetrical)